MEGKTVIEALIDENKSLEKMLNHQRRATIQFYDEMIEAMKSNNHNLKDGIMFATTRLTSLLTEQED